MSALQSQLGIRVLSVKPSTDPHLFLFQVFSNNNCLQFSSNPLLSPWSQNSQKVNLPLILGTTTISTLLFKHLLISPLIFNFLLVSEGEFPSNILTHMFHLQLSVVLKFFMKTVFPFMCSLFHFPLSLFLNLFLHSTSFHPICTLKTITLKNHVPRHKITTELIFMSFSFQKSNLNLLILLPDLLFTFQYLLFNLVSSIPLNLIFPNYQI